MFFFKFVKSEGLLEESEEFPSDFLYFVPRLLILQFTPHLHSVNVRSHSLKIGTSLGDVACTFIPIHCFNMFTQLSLEVKRLKVTYKPANNYPINYSRC